MKAQQQLTRGEFQVMSILWNLPNQSGFITDILSKYAEPQPVYTTLATFLKILTQKGYVQSRKLSNKLFFRATIGKTAYARLYLAPAKDVFFDGSLSEMINFILANQAPTTDELKDIAAAVQAKLQD